MERYLLLGLRLGRHIDGFVDAYYGPPGLAEQVDAEPLQPAGELADEAAALAATAETEFLRAQLLGCETTARRLAGEPISWLEEVERCFGVRPDRAPDEQFVAAHTTLDAALAGDASLAERYHAWLETQVVPAELVDPIRAAFQQELRARTESLFGLPEGESVDFEAVQNEPWGGFNYYQGGLRSRVVINTDLPTYTYGLPDLVAHEMYPGHHTERVWKEALLVEGEGRLEETILLVGTPQSVVSEGIATLAPEIGLGDDVDAVSERIYRDFGVAYDAPTIRAARELQDATSLIGTNAAYLLHEEGRSVDEVTDYLVRYGLMPRERAAKRIEFLTHPTWRAYVSAYSSGYELCKAYVGDDPRRFRTLLNEQLTTADLVR